MVTTPLQAGMHTLPQRLLQWYDNNRRDLPWRTPHGGTPDAYHVWLSEIMLQQTTVAAVTPYFNRFVARWPDLSSLAAAPLEDVLAVWAGLGYYTRARNLHKCARILMADYDGSLPCDEALLRELPGIGHYTAAAIAAIAFGKPATPVDGNFERVMARLHKVVDPLPAARPLLRALATDLTPQHRPGDYVQAVMDLGAKICKPRTPVCVDCPWRAACAGHAAGIADALPHRTPRKTRLTRHGIAFWCLNTDGDVLLRRRPPEGLLGGMLEIPSSEWAETPSAGETPQAMAAAPVDTHWRRLPGVVRHTFTHFHLELAVLAARKEAPATVKSGFWHPLDQLESVGLPSVMAKIARHALRRG